MALVMADIDSIRPSRIRCTLSSDSALMKRRSASLFPTLLHRISRGALPPFYPLGGIPGIMLWYKSVLRWNTSLQHGRCRVKEIYSK